MLFSKFAHPALEDEDSNFDSNGREEYNHSLRAQLICLRCEEVGAICEGCIEHLSDIFDHKKRHCSEQKEERSNDHQELDTPARSSPRPH